MREVDRRKQFYVDYRTSCCSQTMATAGGPPVITQLQDLLCAHGGEPEVRCDAC